MANAPPQDAGFSERILGVLEAREMSIRAFQQALEVAGADNSGYSSVLRYVKGAFPPSVAWVQAAAEILEVPPAWLAFGGSSPAKGVKAYFDRRGGVDDDPPGAADAIKGSAAGVSAMTAGASFAGEDLMIAIVRGIVRAQPDGAPEPTEKDLAALALRLGFAIQGILMAVRREASGTVTAGATLGVLAAVLAYVPAEGEGRTLDDVVRYLPTPPKAKEA